MKICILSLFTFLIIANAFGTKDIALDLKDTCRLDSNPSDCAISATNDNETKKLKVFEDEVLLTVFYAYDCPHCHEFFDTVPELKRIFPNLKIDAFEIRKIPENMQKFTDYAKKANASPTGVPTFFIGNKMIVGFYRENTFLQISNALVELANANAFNTSDLVLPILGKVDVEKMSLINFTLLLGLLDGLNPCAIWVLTFLLGLLVYSKSKMQIFTIGGIFIFASGFVYFAFMSAWFNLFLVIGASKYISILLGIIAICMGLINIKEIFFFKKGISLMIPESVKPTIAKKIRQIINEKNKLASIAMTVILAIFVNFIELGCTIGLPAIFTKILTDRDVSILAKYGYMALYNLMYVIPLIVIVLIFGFTMGHYKLTENQGKILKSISGLLMLGLGFIMIFYPELLSIT